MGPKGTKLQEWRRQHNEEICDLCPSPNAIWVIKSRRRRWVGHVAHMAERRGSYRVLVWRPERRRHLGRCKHRWQHNIKMDLQEVGWGSMDRIDLAQKRDRCRDLYERGNELSGSIQCAEFLY